ncbi:hypothetical protein EP7_001577 [Isosphaeraceae bacterium EP7]
MALSSTVDPATEEPGASAFILGIATLLGSAWLTLISLDATRLPIWDDFHIVPVLTGVEPLSVGWLWSLANEHRLPLPRLILVAACHASGIDFRAGMVLSLATLTLLTGVWVRLAARLRGRTSYGDALFPLLLLGFGHHANMLWSIQFAFILPTALAGLWLAIMLDAPGPPTIRRLLVSALILSSLPLCGATGLAYVPALSAWTVGFAMTAADRARRGLLAALLVSPALALSVLYFRDYRSVGQHDSAGSMTEALRASLQFLTGGLGPGASTFWPWSGWLASGVLLTAFMLPLLRVRRNPAAGPRLLAISAYLAGTFSLALGVGLGRAGMGPMAGFQDRYVTMAAPAWGAAALAYVACGSPRWSRLMPMALFTLLCLLTWPAAQAALEHGRSLREQSETFTRDLKAGMPPSMLTRKYTPFLHPSQDRLHRFLLMLKADGVEPFRAMRDDPSYREVELPVRPSSLRMAEWLDGKAIIKGVDPQLVYVLEAPQVVAGVRIRYSHRNPAGTPARFQLSWRDDQQAGFSEDRRYSNWATPTGDNQEMTIWIGQAVSQIRIQPDNQPCTFEPHSITLLIP